MLEAKVAEIIMLVFENGNGNALIYNKHVT
jgi:hypothetical protein